MSISEGLRTSLNVIRETSIKNNTLYHKYIDEIYPNTDISKFASPLLDDPDLMNEFFKVLVKRIAYTKIETKSFRNKLKVLEGDQIPLGAIGQEIYINPAMGRSFNADDFAGLLAKYEADVKVQYTQVNTDLQYPVTYTREKVRNAFTSWEALESFITGLANSLYNGAYIDEYNLTKGLVACAYQSNQVQTEVISAISSEATANAFLTKARELYLNFQEPKADYNAWRQVGGYGYDVITWSNPEDIVLLIRNDIAAYLDVNTLANAFNIDKKILLGNVIYVSDFNCYDNHRNLVYDGSNIVGIIADKSWFRIKPQDFSTDEFYNANNRTWQMYLNNVKLYNYSLFANAKVFCTSLPSIATTEIKFLNSNPEVAPDGTTVLEIETTPANSTDTITFSSGTEANITVEKVDNRHVKLTGVQAGTSVITATNGTVSATVTATCKVPEIEITNLSGSDVSVVKNQTANVTLSVTPNDGNTPIYYYSSNTSVFTVAKSLTDNNKATITAGASAGSALLICTTGNVSTIIPVTVTNS